MKITVTRREDKHYVFLGIEVDKRELINVSKEVELFGDEWEASQINWSAIGRVTVERTEEFAEALKTAIKEAKKLDAKYIGKVER